MNRTTSYATTDAFGLPVPADRGQDPVLYADARGAGLTRAQLRGHRFRRGPRGVYVPAAAEPSFELQARAWLLVLPSETALFGATAAEWYDLPVKHDPEYHVIVPAGGVVPRRRPGLVPHEGLGPDEWGIHKGLRITAPERTFLDLATSLRRVDLVVVGDAMVRLGLTTEGRLQEAAGRARRRRGVILARKAAGLVRDRVDSPPETVVRLVIIDGGLPCPEPNVDVYDEHGGWIGRPDLCYLMLKLAIQYEGDIHRVDRERWRADVARDEVFLDYGWDVIRVTAHDLRRPAALCHRISLRMERQRRRLG